MGALEVGTTVEIGGFTVEGNSPSGDVMAGFDTGKEGAPEAKLVVEDGKPVTDEDKDKAKLSEAASELGKKGAAAAAEARKAKKEAKESPEPEAEKPEEKQEAKPEEKPEAKPKEGNPRHDPKARMLEATREAAEAKRAVEKERARAEAAENRLRELESRTQPQKAEPQAPEQPKAPEKLSKPRLEEFETYEEYLDARDNYNRQTWEAEQREKQRQAEYERRSHEVTQHIKTKAEAHAARIEAARKADPEFNSRLSGEVLSIYPSPEMQKGEYLQAFHVLADEIMDSEQGPQLMLHLSAHPEDFQRILALRTPEDVKVETRILARSLSAVTAGPSPKPEAVSQAKPPVKPVTGSPHVATPFGYREGMSLDEYANGWQREQAARKR